MTKGTVNEFDKKELMTYDEAIASVNESIMTSLRTVYNDFHEITGHISKSLGKGIRTVLLLSAAANADGMIHTDAIKAAASIELLHLATLVHDDIIDDAPLRRGIPSVQSKFGRKQAVICGDYLLCLSLSTASAITSDYKDKYIDLANSFAKALSKICLGELSQYKNKGNLDLDLFSYLRIIMNKTAALFYISAQAGAIVGEMDTKQVKALARFGLYLGIIFQIIDDCKDYEFNENEAKKPVGKDISEGVVTLPLIIAMAKNSGIRALVSDVIAGKDATFLISEVCRLGGTEDSRFIAHKYEKKALRELDKIEDTNKCQRLSALLEKALSASMKF